MLWQCFQKLLNLLLADILSGVHDLGGGVKEATEHCASPIPRPPGIGWGGATHLLQHLCCLVYGPHAVEGDALWGRTGHRAGRGRWQPWECWAPGCFRPAGSRTAQGYLPSLHDPPGSCLPGPENRSQWPNSGCSVLSAPSKCLG